MLIQYSLVVYIIHDRSANSLPGKLQQVSKGHREFVMTKVLYVYCCNLLPSHITHTLTQMEYANVGKTPSDQLMYANIDGTEPKLVKTE